MNNKEFEILNRKMNLIYEELVCLHRSLGVMNFEKQEKELKIQIENDQSIFDVTRKNREHFEDILIDRKREFKSLDNSLKESN